MSWASERKAMYGVIVAVVVIILVSVPTYFFLQEQPTCFDGKQNGSERGIDCGGDCVRICSADARPIAIKWSRSFEVTEGVYNAVAYLENKNFGAYAESVTYTFKLFDAENILVAERQGITTLSRDGIIPIFEPQIVTGNRVPTRTFFELTNVPDWNTIEEKDQLFIEDVLLRNELERPELLATLVNEKVEGHERIEIVATLFDSAGNAYAASRTLVEDIPGRSERAISFTWPEGFPIAATQVDVIPRIIR